MNATVPASSILPSITDIEAANRGPISITLGGETRFATPETWEAIADELVAKYGGIPDVKNLAAAATPLTATVDAPAKLATVTAISSSRSKPAMGSPEDTVRSYADLEAARAAGFAPAAPLYARGTAVIQMGVDNARRSRMAHDALPLVGEACLDFEARIASERRADSVVQMTPCRMTSTGVMVTPDGTKMEITPGALGSLMGYHAGTGGAGYIQGCWPELRAINVNHWMRFLGEREIDRRNALSGKALAEWRPQEVRFRTRDCAGTTPREVFGVVSSERYTSFDVDRVAAALRIAMPDQARARVTYNGERAIFDVQFHSDIQPEKYVAGEFFKAGIRVRTDDTGGGSLVGEAFVYQNLCLNLMIVDRAAVPLFRIRHVGSTDAIAKRFAQGMRDAKDRLAHFLSAWNYAVDDTIVLPAEEGIDVPDVSVEEGRALLRGICNYVIERELVPVPGRRTEVLPALVRAWESDTSFAGRGQVNRASVLNAFTRYAHTEVASEYDGAEIERSAANLLYSANRRQPNAAPAPLRYLPVGA